MSSSSGRSPYHPSRNRRRSSLEASDATTSPLVLSHLLTTTSSSSTGPQRRSVRSPPTFSPRSTTTRSASRRFFPPDTSNTATTATATGGGVRDDSGGVLGLVAGGAPTTHSNNTTTTPNNNTTTSNDTTSVIDAIPVATLRDLATNCRLTSPSTAVFYASIVFHKTLDLDDHLLYAQALHANHEHQRCVTLLQPLLLSGEVCVLALLLATQALASLQEWAELMELVERTLHRPHQQQQQQQQDGVDTPENNYDNDDDAAWKLLADSLSHKDDTTNIHPVALLCWWQGRAYDELSHPHRAATYWIRALQTDPLCVQAFHSLMDRNLISPQEAFDLVRSLNMDRTTMEWLRRMYLARIDLPPPQQQQQQNGMPLSDLPFRADASSIHHMTPSNRMLLTHDDDDDDNNHQEGNKPDENNQKMPTTTTGTAASHSLQQAVDDAFDKLWSVHKLQDTPEALALAATRCYRRHDLQQALYYCQQLFSSDPLCPQASLVHVATLLALDQKRILFGLAHSWVEASPKLARSWFAVGAYYYCCGRYHAAQRHFCRATRLDPQCTEAWIAFGCAFAACDESDQALATFRAAQRLAPAQHVPLLYMGMEYLRTNHLVLAQHFLTSAYKASSNGGDPLCLHELGVAAYQRCDYDAAIVWLTRALQAVVVTMNTTDLHETIDACQDSFWEPTLFNLGHCYRRTRQFEEAAYCFEKCLALCPGNSTSFTALGFTKHLQGDTDGAIELYHQALSRKPDDPFSSEMLNRALQEALTIKMTLQDDDVISDNTAKSFVSPAAPGRSMTFRSDKKRRSVAGRETNMSMASDGSPSLALDESEDVDMSLAS